MRAFLASCGFIHPIENTRFVGRTFYPLDRVTCGPCLAGENASQHADLGYSSERLRMWDADGKQVIEGLQCVAVFG